MQSTEIKLQRLPHAVGATPVFATAGSSGLDLSAAIPEALVLGVRQTLMIPCGYKIALQPGYEGQIRPRSGLAGKHGVTVSNAPGTIDSDYRGEILVILINHSHKIYMVKPGERIAQLVVCEVPKVRIQWVDVVGETDRGEKGFGSTGKV